MTVSEKLIIRYLGIDFGSSTTNFVGITVNGEVVILGNYETTYHGFATAMAEDSDKGYVYFEQAFDLNNVKLINNLKEGLYNASSPLSKERVSLFFERILDILTDDDMFNTPCDFSRLEAVCFGHPAYYSIGSTEQYIKTLTPILREVFKTKFGVRPRIENCPEPILAAMSYNYCSRTSSDYLEKINDNDVILVLDFGGHTMDMALLQASKKDGRISLKPYERSYSVDSGVIGMGKAITRMILDQIYMDRYYQSKWNKNAMIPYDPRVDEAKCRLFSGKVGEDGGTAPERCKYMTCNEQFTHFALHYSFDEQIPAIDKNGVIHIGLNEGERCIGIDTIFDAVASHIKKYLTAEEIGVADRSIAHILFTGGSSRMEPLRNHAKNALFEISKWRNNNVQSELMMDRPYEDSLAFRSNISDGSNARDIMLSSANAVAIGAALVAKDPALVEGSKKITGGAGVDCKKCRKETEKKLNKFKADVSLLKQKYQRQLMDSDTIRQDFKKLALDAIDCIDNADKKNKIRKRFDDVSNKESDI